MCNWNLEYHNLEKFLPFSPSTLMGDINFYPTNFLYCVNDYIVGLGNYSINCENRDNLASNDCIVIIFLAFKNRKLQ